MNEDTVSIDVTNEPTLAERIADGRKARGLSQEDVARRLGVSRPTYIAIEKGLRSPKPEELAHMAGLFGRSIHDLVGSRPIMTEFSPQFRSDVLGAERTQVVDDAISLFRGVCEDYVWLEKIVNSGPLRHRYVNEYDVSGLSVVSAAEEIASQERSRLRLGLSAVPNLLDILEAEGLRVFVLPVPEFRIAGMFVYNDALGACVLINGLHPQTRQLWSVAHEYAHYLTDRYHTDITLAIEGARKPKSEQFADAFAASFLMPSSAIRSRFRQIVQSALSFTVADLCWLADLYGVSPQAMCYRLEGLGLIDRGAWEEIQRAGGPPNSRGGRGQQDKFTRLPDRYMRLAVRAFEDEVISEGELARLLRCSRVEAREAVDTLTMSETIDVADGSVFSSQLNLSEFLGLAAAERASQ